MPLRVEHDARVAPLTGDPLAIAQTLALDASVFPRMSLPSVLVVKGTAPYVWVARATADGPIVGYVAIARHGPDLEITHLAVGADARRTGLGRALLRAALEGAREMGHRVVHLHVSTGNAAAIALYASEGFRAVRRIRGFYSFPSFPDGGDALRMTRRAR